MPTWISPEVQQLLLSLASGSAIAVVAAVVTVRLSLKRFYSERWWDRRADAYQRIIEALYDMKTYADDWIEREMVRQMKEAQGKVVVEVEKPGGSEILLKWQNAEVEIHRRTAIGAFIISDAVARELDTLHSELREAHRYPDIDMVVEQESKALGKCLHRVCEHAKRELKVHKL